MERYLLLATACAGCFGEGPTPMLPTGVDIMYSVPPQDVPCTYTPFIDDVVIGNGYLNVSLSQWYPQGGNDCGGPPGGGTQFDIEIHHIPLVGGERKQSSAGLSSTMGGGGSPPTRVAAALGHSAWVTNNNSSPAELKLGALPMFESPVKYSLDGIGGYHLPTGFVADDTSAYVMTTSGASNIYFNTPDYPCCGNNQPSGSAPSIGLSVEWNSAKGALTGLPLATTDVVYAETLKSGLAHNATTLFYASRATTESVLLIRSMEKATATDPVANPVTRITIPFGSTSVLAGLDATTTHLAWTQSPNYQYSPIPTPSCTVSTVDLLAAPTDAVWVPQQIYTTLDFTCLDVAVDATHAYFTIVDVIDNSQSGGISIRMRGIGLARKALDGSGQLESIRHGINTDSAGPRRVYLHEDDVYAVDGYAVVRIPKSAFEGRDDF